MISGSLLVLALLVPIVLFALSSERVAFVLLLASVPLYNLSLFVALSHTFRLHEIAVLVLLVHQLRRWLADGQIEIPNAPPLLWLWLFLGVASLSIVWAAINPASVPVHPYDATFQSRLFVESTLSLDYISQLALRILFVVAITVLALTLRTGRRIELSIRALVYGAVFAGLVGVAYQLSIVTGTSAFVEVVNGFGFSFKPIPGRLGPVPRMFSTTGEPGFTAGYLLYALALVLSAIVFVDGAALFDENESLILLGTLGILLALTTGTTGYGGLLILCFVVVSVLLVLPSLRSSQASRLLKLALPAVGFLLVVTMVLAGQQIADIVGRQIGKITFQSGSGNIRRFYMEKSYLVLIERPLLGAGIGSHSAPSYIFTLLAETGPVGAGVLVVSHISAFRRALSTGVARSKGSQEALVAVAVAGATLFATSLVAKSISSLILPWYWFGVALPIAAVMREFDPFTETDSDRPNKNQGPHV